MIVVVLTAASAGLRGDLTRWLLEIAPGVFVGRPGARVRDAIWDRIESNLGTGRALMVHSTRNEQGMTFRTAGHDWQLDDLDGYSLVRRPSKAPPRFRGDAPAPMSAALRRKKFGREAERIRRDQTPSD